MSAKLLRLSLGITLIAGCSSPGGYDYPELNPNSPRASPYITQNETDQARVRRMMGAPKGVYSHGDGTVTWHYDNSGELWIPFNFGYTYQASDFTFDKDGKIVKQGSSTLNPWPWPQ